MTLTDVVVAQPPFSPGQIVRFVGRRPSYMSRPADRALMEHKVFTVATVDHWDGVGWLLTLREDETRDYWHSTWFAK